MNSPHILSYPLGHEVMAFSTLRQGGTSEGNYAEFNINRYCGDDPTHIRENRQALCRYLGIAENRLVMPHQVHGTTIRTVHSDFVNLPAEQQEALMEGVDAIMTNERGLCIGVSTADCIPILLYDAAHRAIAVVHAGWRGTVQRIAQLTVRQMASTFDTRPSALQAVIGPGISLEAFEVGDEVYEEFAAAQFNMNTLAQRFPTNGNTEKWHIDLWTCNRDQLTSEGVPTENIQVAGVCTYLHSHQFFSARRLGIHSGRIFSGILLR